MAKRILTKCGVNTFKYSIYILMAVGILSLLGSFVLNEKIALFDRGIAWIAIGIAVMSILFGIISWDDTHEIKEQLNRIEEKMDLKKVD